VSAVVVLAGGAVAIWGLTRPGNGPAASFEHLLQKSATAHQLVGEAVSGACASAAPGAGSRQAGMVKLRQAVVLRQSVLADLADLGGVAGRLPSGRLLFRELGALSRSALEADRDYESWLQDLEATGCYSGPTNNLDWNAAQAAAGRADRATRRLATTWAEVAPDLHMPAGLATQA
jgi:hypothetical protein